MPANGKAISQLVKLGMKYGPLAYEAAKNGRDPAKDAIQKVYTSKTARRSALAHARTLIDGSVMPSFDKGRAVFVVLSEDEPIGVHPYVETPLAELLQHADLTQRIRP